MNNLAEKFLNIIVEKLSGDTFNKQTTDDDGHWGGLYRGKKFASSFSIQNFGIEVDNTDELVLGHFYNIYIEDYDQWFCGYTFQSTRVGLYNFFMDNQNETVPVDKKQLSNMIKKGYIVNFLA